MIQEFSKIIPVDEQRLSTSGIWKNEAKGAIELSSRTIFDDLSTLIKKKGFRALSNNEYTSLIESASFIMTRDHIKEFYPLIIIFIIFIVNLIILYFLARWKNPEGRNIAIFETALIMQRFWCGVVKNTPHLIIPTMVFLIVPHYRNFLLAINILLSEVATNPTFFTWIRSFQHYCQFVHIQ
ncbi:hypothetical protein RhiirA1_538705 [Rhizophagus irregularis]|uniref:Uncharacterized protein n=1 Tax=Rhizophagus irregularis TaxID=588596 RepID=A0A2I1E4I5_9GLOM|nr:hypothetical protein RhiirA1_538705 [Rhizophagus irregularis]PKY17020.1 hypothetical protein RhiirB3_521649 [Rhizophagus irregularis]